MPEAILSAIRETKAAVSAINALKIKCEPLSSEPSLSDSVLKRKEFLSRHLPVPGPKGLIQSFSVKHFDDKNGIQFIETLTAELRDHPQVAALEFRIPLEPPHAVEKLPERVVLHFHSNRLTVTRLAEHLLDGKPLGGRSPAQISTDIFKALAAAGYSVGKPLVASRITTVYIKKSKQIIAELNFDNVGERLTPRNVYIDSPEHVEPLVKLLFGKADSPTDIPQPN